MSKQGKTVSRDDHATARNTHLATRVVAAGEAPALSVIVPTRNEAGNIGPLLARLENALGDIAAEVLIVDDSDDATPEIAREIAARSALVIRVRARPAGQRQGGLGGAVLAGLYEALGPLCAVMDADLQHPPELLEMLLNVSQTGARNGSCILSWQVSRIR